MGVKFCVVGKSLPHTLSPRVHAAFGRMDYDVVELEDEDALRDFVRKGEYAGFNVTIPYKQAVMGLVDELSDIARAAGAVNTVARIDGRTVGFNTDVEGMRYALDVAGIDLAGKNVLILGSGGTSHTAQFLAKKAGARRVDVASRSGNINYANCYELSDVQIVINATPVGMTPHAFEAPLDISRFQDLEGVFDAVYNPARTLLVKRARELGLRADNGMSMLIEQARLAHNVFCRAGGGEIQPPEATMRAKTALERERRTISLVGMAGAGKTTLGREIARATGRKFLDTDEWIAEHTGKSIPEIFADEGEKKFREYEAEAVRVCCSVTGAVVATGGGAALREDNRFYMSANGPAVYVMRRTEDLAREGRPLYKDEDAVRTMYESRRALYESVADLTILNDKDVASAAKYAIEELDL